MARYRIKTDPNWSLVEVPYAVVYKAKWWLGKPGLKGLFGYGILDPDRPDTVQYRVSDPNTAFLFKLRWA